MKAVAEEMGIGFLGIGFQPKWRREDIPIMPKVKLQTKFSKQKKILFNLLEVGGGEERKRRENK